MSQENIGRDYVRLALALDQHLPGFVDAYFGPPAWQAEANSNGLRPLPELAQQASKLEGAIASSDTLDPQRQDFLAGHVGAMQTSLRLLQGDRMVLADEAEALYDVRPSWFEASMLEGTHRLLHDLLPPGTTLRERVARRKRALEISVEQVERVLPLIHHYLRHLSRDRFPLPDDEAVEFAFVQNQPWMAYNWYRGRGQSRIEINTDLPLYISDLATLVAHEAYPGHHTELTIKETRLVQQAGHVEHSLTLLNSPSAVISEGIATCGLTTILSDDDWVAWHTAEIFPRSGLDHLDAQRERMIDLALEQLAGVYDNAAFLLHEQGAEAASVRGYLQHHGLLTEHEASKAIEFLSSPLDRAYIFTYNCGRRLLEELFALKQERLNWYARLLAEAVTPSQVRNWMVNPGRPTGEPEG